MALKTIKDVVPTSLLLDACRPRIQLSPCIAYRPVRIDPWRRVHETCLCPALELLAYKIARLCPLPFLRRFHIRLDTLGGDQPHLMAMFANTPGPVVGTPQASIPMRSGGPFAMNVSNSLRARRFRSTTCPESSRLVKELKRMCSPAFTDLPPPAQRLDFPLAMPHTHQA
jgi:hypothetical protein